MIRLLVTSRWLGYLALTVVFAFVASLFGLWQWDRREQAVAAINLLESNWDKPPVALEDALDGGFTDASEWLPVVVSGRYLPEDQVLVRTRPRGGQVGFEVLVSFETAQGAVVVVNRGWVPTGEAQDFPDVLPAAPSADIMIVARLKPTEPTLQGRGAPSGQLPSIDLRAFQDIVGYPVPTDHYLLLAEETPAASPAPLRATRPVLDEGPHLSYSFQWFVFGILAFTGLVVLLRQEAQRKAGIEPKRRAKPSDAEAEDALLERVRG